MKNSLSNAFHISPVTVAVISCTFLPTFDAFGQSPSILERPLFNIGTFAAASAGVKSQLQRKVDFQLLELKKEYTLWTRRRSSERFIPRNALIPIRGQAGNFVVVDAIAQGSSQALTADLQLLGCTEMHSHKRMVSAWCPIGDVNEMGKLASLNTVRAATSINSVGDITSQGDVAMRADIGRVNSSVDGNSIKVGTLSDSYDCLGGAAADVLSNDLPPGVEVLDDTACPASDEGRGMMQLIADVAPGAAQAFHTAFNGQAAFANGIIALQGVGADVINDDVFYLAEPMFQDGIIAQAVDTVKNAGVAYFSSAGNSGRNSYESDFNPSGQFDALNGGELHDFDAGPGVDIFQQFTLPAGTTTFSFQWSEPYFSVSGLPGSASDYDIFICVNDTLAVDSSNCPIGGLSDNLGGDPIEVIQATVSGGSITAFIAISKFSGGSNNFLKYIAFGGSIDEYDTASSTTSGHSNAAGAEAVGAAFYALTPEFTTTTPILNNFSSAGGTPILFDLSGNPISELRQKPEIVAPDGTNTNFFGNDIGDPGDGSDLDNFPNFFGTSAAAPHAAAVAALMLEAAGGSGSLIPDQIYTSLESTAIDIVRRSSNGPLSDPGIDNLSLGVDFDSGYGLIQADAAILAVAASQCNGDFNNDGDVDNSDAFVFSQAFGSITGDDNYNPAADFDSDGDVDNSDAFQFAQDFGRTDC